MPCPDAFRISTGSFFAPGECSGCKLLTTEKTSLRGIQVYFCRNLDAHATSKAKLVSVIDGDTVFVELPQKESVRLLGIDAPEKSPGDHAKNQCTLLGVSSNTLQVLAKLSQIHLCGLCPAGSLASLQTTGKVRDSYGRILAGVFVGDLCINRRMVEEGYAMTYQGLSDWESYKDLELQAKEAGRGIWGLCEEPYYPASSKTYHRPGCASARNLAARFQTREEVKSAGLGACSVCLPDYRRT